MVCSTKLRSSIFGAFGIFEFFHSGKSSAHYPAGAEQANWSAGAGAGLRSVYPSSPWGRADGVGHGNAKDVLLHAARDGAGDGGNP